jgi:hypothetical protein
LLLQRESRNNPTLTISLRYTRHFSVSLIWLNTKLADLESSGCADLIAPNSLFAHQYTTVFDAGGIPCPHLVANKCRADDRMLGTKSALPFPPPHFGLWKVVLLATPPKIKMMNFSFRYLRSKITAKK